VFSGDTLFAGSIGRTDLPGGSTSQLLAGIDRHLMTLPPATRVFPGHGPETTIAAEAAENPYLE
jgi:glyoxylase-like metal-dependent hydrolase (beta-lactamase superfamily II)